MDYAIDLNSNTYDSEAWENETILLPISWLAWKKPSGLLDITAWQLTLLNLLLAGF